MKVSCVLLGPSQGLLRSLKNVLEPVVEIVAMADNVLSFRDGLDALQPGLAVIDLLSHSPDQGKFLRHLSDRYVDLRIIVVGDDDDPEIAHAMLGQGAMAYVLKRSAATELTVAVAKVLAGNIYVSPDVEAEHDSESARK